MPWILGTDEAGYGPNLGPLVIAGVILKVPELWDSKTLYDRLSHCISEQTTDKERCVFVDSKMLYKPGQGLGRLEENVMAAIRALGAESNSTNDTISTWQEFWNRLTSANDHQRAELPWYAGFDHDLPLMASPDRIAQLGDRLVEGLSAADVELVAVSVRTVLTPEFNRQLSDMERRGEHVSKGSVLTNATLELVHSLSEPLPDGEVSIHCDKHGGRNRYMPALQTAFPDRLIEVRREGRQQSEYRWGAKERRRRIQFTAKGDRFLPSALASLFAKYVREIAMKAFNEFWINEIPALRPTAGYPTDAKRFRADIAEKQKKLDISDEILWRSR
jgi:ribonuclease HII